MNVKVRLLLLHLLALQLSHVASATIDPPTPRPLAACVQTLLTPDEFAKGIRFEFAGLQVQTKRGNNIGFARASQKLAEKPGELGFVIHLEFLAQKELNGVKYLGFDRTTAVTDYFRALALSKLEEFPDLKVHIRPDEIYLDDKTARFVVHSTDKGLRKRAELYYEACANEFARTLDKVGLPAITKNWTRQLPPPQKWIVGGAGDTWNQADVAARFSRALAQGFDRAFSDFQDPRVIQLLIKRLDETMAYRAQLRHGRLGPYGITTTGNYAPALSEEVYAFFRAYVPPSRETYFQDLKVALSEHFGMTGKYDEKLTDAEVLAIHRLQSTVDQYFKPGFLKLTADELPPIDLTHGTLSVDFAGIGAMNLHEVDDAVVDVEAWIANQKGMMFSRRALSKRFMEGITGAIDKATRRLDRRKNNVEVSLRERGLIEKMPFTGDDGQAAFVRPPDLKELGAWFKDLLQRRQDLLAADIRQVVLRPSLTADNAGLLRDLGMDIQKKLRGALRKTRAVEEGDVQFVNGRWIEKPKVAYISLAKIRRDQIGFIVEFTRIPGRPLPVANIYCLNMAGNFSEYVSAMMAEVRTWPTGGQFEWGEMK